MGEALGSIPAPQDKKDLNSNKAKTSTPEHLHGTQ
jgi:hypothetical protein